METQRMTENDFARMSYELDRLLNDPDVPLQPSLIWHLLDKISDWDQGGTMLSRILGSGNGNEDRETSPAD
jgi:hypothetical protein